MEFKLEKIGNILIEIKDKKTKNGIEDLISDSVFIKKVTKITIDAVKTISKKQDDINERIN